jgi:hypothetical protein
MLAVTEASLDAAVAADADHGRRVLGQPVGLLPSRGAMSLSVDGLQKRENESRDALESLDKRVAKPGAAVQWSPMVGGLDIPWYDTSCYAPSPVKQRWARFDSGGP